MMLRSEADGFEKTVFGYMQGVNDLLYTVKLAVHGNLDLEARHNSSLSTCSCDCCRTGYEISMAE